MLTFRAVTPALAVVLMVAPPASAASPAKTPSALRVTSFTAPSSVVSGDLLSVRATLGNRSARAGTTHADVILVGARTERRLARVVVRSIKPDRRATVVLKAPVPAAGLVGGWKVRVCADVKRVLGAGRRGACRTSTRGLQVLARPASTGAAAPGTSVPATPVTGGGVLPPGPAAPGPAAPTPPAPPAPSWKLEMTPDPLVLGAIPAGADGDEPALSERPFVITNTGGAPSPEIWLSEIGYQNGVITNTVMDAGSSDYCGVLDPGESCSGDIRWNPRGPGDLEGQIRVLRPATSGPFAYETFQTFPFQADLISRVWFGASNQTVTVNETSREFSLTVYNSGDLSGPVSLVPEFPVPSPSGTCSGTALAPDESCTVIRKGCGLPGSTTVVPYQYFSGTVAASPVANLTVKVPAATSTTC